MELDWGDPVVGRRLLHEHLDQSHDGASRPERVVERQVRRLGRLLPPPPSRILDAACGPGLYASRLAAAGHRVTAIDVNESALRHARRLGRDQSLGNRLAVRRADLRTSTPLGEHDAAILVYHVLEGFPRRQQTTMLHRLAAALRPGGRLIVEMRLRPDQPPGRVSSWDVVPFSLLSDKAHLLLVDTVYDEVRNTFVLRETAVFDDGTTAAQQTSSALCRFERIPFFFGLAGFEVGAVYDGWSRHRATELSETVLVVARR